MHIPCSIFFFNFISKVQVLQFQYDYCSRSIAIFHNSHGKLHIHLCLDYYSGDISLKVSPKSIYKDFQFNSIRSVNNCSFLFMYHYYNDPNKFLFSKHFICLNQFIIITIHNSFWLTILSMKQFHIWKRTTFIIFHCIIYIWSNKHTRLIKCIHHINVIHSKFSI